MFSDLSTDVPVILSYLDLYFLPIRNVRDAESWVLLVKGRHVHNVIDIVVTPFIERC